MTARSARGRAAGASAIVAVAVLLAGCGASSTGLPGEGSNGAAKESGAAARCTPQTVTLPSKPIVPVSKNPSSKLPVTVTSADGKKVTVTDNSRILAVNLYGSLAEIVFNLGLGDNLVGRDTSTTMPEAAKLPLVTRSGHDLSAEPILSLEPTVVLADDSIGPPEVLNQLRKAGVPVVLIDSEQNLDRIPMHVRQVAAALGVQPAGELLTKRVQRQIATAKSGLPTDGTPPKIAFLYLRGSAGVYLIGGKGAGSDAMIEAIGAVDAGSALGLEGFRPLTSEGLVKAAPDAILVMTDGLESVGGIDGLLKMPGVGQTPAGEDHRIIDMDDASLLNFGSDTGRTIAALAKAVHDGCGTAATAS